MIIWLFLSNTENRQYYNKYIYDIEQKLSKKYSKTLKTKAINNPSLAYKDKDINDATLASYYNFDQDEIDAINQLRKLNYTFKYIKS